MSSSIVLVCAVLASLAAGVLMAYGICAAMFALFSRRARQIAPRTVPPISVPSPIAEG